MTLEEEIDAANREEWREQVAGGQTDKSYEDWLYVSMREYDVTIDRTSVRSHVFRVWATNDDATDTLAHEAARNYDFGKENEGGVEYDTTELEVGDE